MHGFYQRQREYVCDGKQSVLFNDVVPQTVTLRGNLNEKLLGSRKAYIVDRSTEASNGLHDTVFREVNIAPFESIITPEMGEVMSINTPPQLVSENKYAEKIFEIFKETIKRNWKSDKFKVITHSSGSDSRLISTAIKQLHNEHGDNWLGDVIFIEAEGESKEFLEIMNIQGWESHQYAVYSNTEDPNSNHDLSLTFNDAWKKLNGVMGFPVNVWWDAVEWLQCKRLIPDDDDMVQAWTGYGSNEVSKALYHPQQTMAWYFKWHYYHELATFPMKVETVHPFHSYYFISEFLKWIDSDNPMSFATVTVSKKIVPFIAPELNVVNRDIDKIKDLGGYRTVSRRIMERNWADYMGSWYGQNINPNIEPTSKIEYSDWWGNWCLASFWEHLINTGRQIQYEV